MSRFPLLGEPLALDLVNTRINRQGEPVDLLTEPAHLAEWLAAHPADFPTPPEIDASTLRAVLDLRGHIAAGIEAIEQGRPVAETGRAALNRAARSAPAVHQLTGTGRALHRDGPAERVMCAILAEAAIELLAGDQASRIRRCAGPDCVLRFVSTHPRRQWCSPAACGNRVRVARHYRREHSSPSRT